MTAAAPDPTQAPSGPDAETVRRLLVSATQRLLGDTIAIADQDWAAPSRLPGWSRGHLATHLARQADALGRLVQGALSQHPQQMYGSPEQRDAEIESGAARSALELQIDLDTASGALSQNFDAVAEASGWDLVVELGGGDLVPVRALPLARLAEVVLHHVDLDVGYSADEVDQQTAELLLTWCAFRLRRRSDFPRLLLLSDSGFQQPVGVSGEETSVTGPSAALLGWLTGRAGAEPLAGADGLRLPAYS